MIEPYILDDEYRVFMEQHYRAIAEQMAAKRLRRAPWKVELSDGHVFKFTVTCYAKKGSAAAAGQYQELDPENVGGGGA